MILPDLLWLLANSIGRAALGATLVPGLGEWASELQNYVDRNGKFSKFMVAYSPVAPPPVFWDYICGECRVYERDKRTCKWVSESGFPQDGEIHPAAWCAVWTPKEGERPFSWVGKVPWFLREPQPVFP